MLGHHPLRGVELATPRSRRIVMAIEVLVGAGTLLIVGTAFALWLGMTSLRLDHEREEHAGKTE